MSEQSYDLFISYLPEDKPWVSQFVAALREKDLHPFWDDEILAGQDWQKVVGQALRESDTLIVILSPEGAPSNLMFFELGAAIAGKKRIIPVAHGALDWAQIPALLRRYKFLNETSPGLAAKCVAEVVGRLETTPAHTT